MRLRLYLLFIVALIFFSWFILSKNNEPIRYIGKVPIPNIKNVYFNIYQENKFDHSTAILYEIIVNDTIIFERHFLIGTADYLKDTKMFGGGNVNNIVYLTFIDSNKVFAIHDIINNTGFPIRKPSEGYTVANSNADSLFLIVNEVHPNFKKSW